MKKIFFYLFIFILPWQTRIIFTPGKTEFLSFSIYLSEIFLWLALASWLTSVDLKKILFTPPFEKGGKGGIWFFCFFALLSIFWAPDRVAAFRVWLYIIDGIMVYLFLQNFRTDAKNLALPLKIRWGRGELWNSKTGLIYVFLFSIFIAASFGIWQFFNLGSPAEKWLGLAERGAWNLGDIVVEADGGRFLRAYGPFPHPNIFGGYLAAGILLIFYLKSHLPNTSRPRSIWKKYFLYFFGGIFLFALFLTFSRSAWLGLLAAIIFIIFKFLRNSTLTCAAAQVNVKDKNDRFAEFGAVAPNSAKEKRSELLNFFIFLFSLTIIFSIIFLPLVKTRAESSGRLEKKSNTERVESWKEGLALWRENPILGAGIGNNTITNYELRITNKKQEPSHNIFILVLAELGAAGFFIYLFIWKRFWKTPVLRPLLILFFIIGLLDHYIWTLYPGAVLFWLGLGMIEVEDANGSKDVHPSMVRGD